MIGEVISAKRGRCADCGEFADFVRVKIREGSGVAKFWRTVAHVCKAKRDTALSDVVEPNEFRRGSGPS